MFLRKIIIILLFVMVAAGILFVVTGKEKNEKEVRELHVYVDPWIGVKGAGSNVPGPQVPFGSINPSPDTRNAKPGGYGKGQPILGISQTHVSGTGGAGKYGNFLVQPQTGLHVMPDEYVSEKTDEEAYCGYYKVRFSRFNTLAEVTASHHCAIYQFEYPASDSSSLIIDISHHIPWDCLKMEGIFEHADIHYDKTQNAFFGEAGWWGGYDHQDYKMYFYAKLSKEPDYTGFWEDDRILLDQDNYFLPDTTVKRMGAFYNFSTSENEKIYFKIGISLQSHEKAKAYLENEIPGWDFNSIRTSCEKAWDVALSSILIDDETATEKELAKFYTSLYHTMVMPRDRTGDHPNGSDHVFWDDHYTIWDTYRTVFPLHSLINEDVYRDNIRSFIVRRKLFGEKVTSPYIAGKELGEQGGNNVDNVIAEGYVKGIKGIDWESAYEVVKYHAEEMRLPYYRENDNGWVAWTDHHYWTSPSVSKTLEYNHNDFSAAMMAKEFDTSNYQRYLKRSMGWVNQWNPDVTSDGYVGFLQGKKDDGTWVLIDPKKNGHWGHQWFYEADAWTYSYYVPHNMAYLIEKMGGDEIFSNRMEHFMKTEMRLDNEPAFLVPWLFHYANKPYLTSKAVQDGLSRTLDYYDAGANGGDEDSGAMGGWHVFAQLGFYPVAGTDIYLIHGPQFKKITIQSSYGKRIEMQGRPANKKNDIYIQSATLNGKKFNQSWIRHEQLMNGEELTFQMDKSPSHWATKGVRPPSFEEIIK